MSHTPGPWAMVRVQGANHSIGIHGPLGPMQRIAVLWHDGDASTEGNARLIAAAPDLLAALVTLIHNGPMPQTGTERRAYQTAALAVAKAEDGGQ